MCGFFQVIQKEGPINKERFVSALNTLHHRGPDSRGVHLSEYDIQTNSGILHLHAAFGHQRLSILDLSDRSQQPFIHDGNVFLYNGELYNFRQLGAELENGGIEINTNGDTEVFMKSLLSHGTAALSGFNGMWAFSLFHPTQGSLLISRDRYGKKPLFYYLDETTLCISSNIRAIQRYLGLQLEFTRESLAEYFMYGSMHPGSSTHTHFKHISQFLPGHYYDFDLRQWSMRGHTYFDWFSNSPSWDDDPPDLTDILKDSVASRLVSDRPVALLLSGGIDSSLLFSVLYKERLHERLHIFMGDTGRSDDYAYAKQCVEQVGVKAETVVLDYDSNSYERFLKVCRHHEKAFPFNGNALAMPQMYESIAAHGIPVVLDGTGGDEIFGGYWERQIPFAIRNAIRDREWQWIRELMADNRKSNSVRKNVINALMPERLINSLASLKGKVYSQLHPLLTIDPSVLWKAIDPDPLNKISADFNFALASDMAPGGRLGEWIWHNDRNAMMYSVENRSPLLDFRLHQFLFSGYKSKYHSHWNKYELRKAFDIFQPLPTQWRREKQGFRWDGKHFIRNNKSRILELIDSADCFYGVLDNRKLVRIAHKYPKILRTSIGKRALCVAGIEESLINQ